ncbi:MAG: diguanylate cyclase [Nitrospirae bacterium]|nr:diguanylate cyclase [Nitrospirota bacterium]
MYTINVNILIAEASEEAKKVLSDILQNEGYRCLFAEGRGEIIDKIYAEEPDVIILGTGEAAPSSFETLEKLKAVPSTREIPVILVASQGDSQQIIKGFQLGAYDYFSFPYIGEEIMARIRNINYTNERLKELVRLLDRDYLTGLYNRRFFMIRLYEEFAKTIKYNIPLSILMIDIDDFKNINDLYGHICGDMALKQLSGALQSALRTEDVIARYGGDEFIIMLPATFISNALVVSEKLRVSIKNKSLTCSGVDIKQSVTISLGVTIYNGDKELSPDQLITESDAALMEAKKGKDRVVVHNRC